MSYPTLAYDPTPGDPTVIRQVASDLGAIAGDAESIGRRLRAVGTAVGDSVWRGTAADAFHRLLEDAGPIVGKLAEAHRVAEDALSDYANVLAGAQDMSRDAERDADRAQADRDRCAGDRRRAAEEAAAHERRAWECRSRLHEARTRQILGVGDPVYQAELARYETSVRSALRQAESAAEQRRQRQQDAQHAESAACGRLEAARLLAEQATEVRNATARTTVQRLDDAGRMGTARTNPLERAGHWLDDLGRKVVTSAEFDALLDLMGNASNVLFGIALAAAAISIIFPPAAVVTGPLALIALAASNILGVAALIGTAAGFRYGTRSTTDPVLAAIGAIPGPGRALGIAGKVVTRTIGRPTLLSRGLNRLNNWAAKDVVRWADGDQTRIAAGKHFEIRLDELTVVGGSEVHDLVVGHSSIPRITPQPSTAPQCSPVEAAR